MAKFWMLLFVIIDISRFYFLCVCGFPFMVDKTIKIDRFVSQCPGVANLPLYFENVHFTSVRRVYYISARIVAKRDFSSHLKFHKTVKFDRFLGRCPGYPDLPFYFTTVHFTRVNSIYYVNTKVIATRDATSNLKVLLELQRCKSKEALDSCEPYPDVNMKNICEIVTAKFQPWTPFIQSLKPELSCPVKKGVYTSTNGTFDGGAFVALPVEGWYWRIHAKVFEMIEKESEMIMCLYLEGQIVNI